MAHSPRLVTALAAACFAVLALAPASAAQPLVGRLTGTVKNLAGQPIKAATIRAVNPSTIPNEFTATSDDKGEWGILGMRGGLWEVTASFAGIRILDRGRPRRSQHAQRQGRVRARRHAG